MNPIAWWQDGPEEAPWNNSIWYVNPYDYISEDVVTIPLYEGWEEKYNEVKSSCGEYQGVLCTPEGEFYVVDTPKPPPPPEEPISEIDQMWKNIADSISDGVNVV